MGPSWEGMEPPLPARAMGPLPLLVSAIGPEGEAADGACSSWLRVSVEWAGGAAPAEGDSPRLRLEERVAPVPPDRRALPTGLPPSPELAEARGAACALRRAPLPRSGLLSGLLRPLPRCARAWRLARLALQLRRAAEKLGSGSSRVHCWQKRSWRPLASVTTSARACCSQMRCLRKK